MAGEAGAEGPCARGEAQSIEPTWVLPEGHHQSRVTKSGRFRFRAQIKQAQRTDTW